MEGGLGREDMCSAGVCMIGVEVRGVGKEMVVDWTLVVRADVHMVDTDVVNVKTDEERVCEGRAGVVGKLKSDCVRVLETDDAEEGVDVGVVVEVVVVVVVWVDLYSLPSGNWNVTTPFNTPAFASDDDAWTPVFTCWDNEAPVVLSACEVRIPDTFSCLLSVSLSVFRDKIV